MTVLSLDYAKAWRLWNTGQFANRAALAAHLGTSRQTLTHALKLYGFTPPPRKPTMIGPPLCACCGGLIARKEHEPCSDWRRRKRCTPCRQSKARVAADPEALPFERYGIDPGLMIEELRASDHPPGEGELTWETMDRFIGVPRCERPVFRVWFGDVRA